MKKNVAGQIIGAEMVTAADGSAFTGAVTCYFNLDNAGQTIGSVGSGICTHEGNGYHSYTPTQGETSGDHIAWTFIGAGAVPATIQVYPSFPQSVDVSTRPTVAEIWSYVTRSLTDKLGFFISGTKTTLDDLNDISVGAITGEVQNGVFARVAITGDAIQIIEGNVKTISIDLGAEWNLTGKLVYFVMKRSNSNDAAIVNREVDTIVDAVNGLAEIDLAIDETTPKGCYSYQVELRNDPADDEPETAMEGTVEIKKNLRS